MVACKSLCPEGTIGLSLGLNTYYGSRPERAVENGVRAPDAYAVVGTNYL